MTFTSAFSFFSSLPSIPLRIHNRGIFGRKFNIEGFHGSEYGSGPGAGQAHPRAVDGRRAVGLA